MNTTEMSYKELQDKAAELNIDFGKPLNQVRKAELQQAIDSRVDSTSETEPVSEESSTEVTVKHLPTETIKERIVQLGRQGLTKVDIQKQMESEGYDIRYAYILVVLKAEQIEVPKARRGRKPAPKAEPTDSAE